MANDAVDNSANSWFLDPELESPFLNDQYSQIIDFFDEDLSTAFGDDFQSPLSRECSSPTCFPTAIQGSSSSSSSSLCVSPIVMAPPPEVTERPAKQHKPNGYTFSNTHTMFNFNQASSSPMILTFGNPNVPEISFEQVSLGNLYPEDDVVSGVLASHGSFVNHVGVAAKATAARTKAKKPGSSTRPSSKSYDHIAAERKRRQQLSQQFMALSAMIPGLKKMDKTSVLGDAIKYLKYLQERVNTLEEKTTKQTVESVVLVKKSQVLLAEDEGSSDETVSTIDQLSLPEIEAKVCDKKILLRIRCENQTGLLTKFISKVEKLNLTVTNTSVAQFRDLALDITIIAEMDKEFNLTAKELARCLQSALLPVEFLGKQTNNG